MRERSVRKRIEMRLSEMETERTNAEHKLATQREASVAREREIEVNRIAIAAAAEKCAKLEALAAASAQQTESIAAEQETLTLQMASLTARADELQEAKATAQTQAEKMARQVEDIASEMANMRESALQLELDLDLESAQREAAEQTASTERQARHEAEQRLQRAEEAILRLETALKACGGLKETGVRADVDSLKRYFTEALSAGKFEVHTERMRSGVTARLDYQRSKSTTEDNV